MSAVLRIEDGAADDDAAVLFVGAADVVAVVRERLLAVGAGDDRSVSSSLSVVSLLRRERDCAPDPDPDPDPVVRVPVVDGAAESR